MKNANLVYRVCCLALGFALGLSGCREEAPAAAPAAKTVADHFDIKVGSRTAHMQVAVLPLELERGLMERRDLGADEGMIFIFEGPQRLSFWMHDTPTPLDLGYFAPAGELAEIYPLLPFDERTVQSRSSALQFALEMRQGWYKENGVRPGDRLDLAALASALRDRGFDPRKLGVIP